MVIKMDKKNIENEIENFIIYFTSDDTEREHMRLVLKDYLKEECDENG